MQARYILSEYLKEAMAQAEYEELNDNSFAGRIPPCKGVIAFGSTLRECEDELRSTLEDWLLLGLKLKHPLPEIHGINLNQEPLNGSPADEELTESFQIEDVPEIEKAILTLNEVTLDMIARAERMEQLIRDLGSKLETTHQEFVASREDSGSDLPIRRSPRQLLN